MLISLGAACHQEGYTCLSSSFQSSLKVPIGSSLLLDGVFGSVKAGAHLVTLACTRLPA